MHTRTFFDQDNNEYKVFSLSNTQGFSVEVCELGASLLSFKYPDGTDIIVGPKDKVDMATWAHFGSICGRVAGRISNGKITVDGIEYELEKNQNGLHHRHGGSKGFSKVAWNGNIIKHPYGQAIEMKYTSRDGEGGYPGTIHVTATYILNEANELLLQTEVIAESTTVANITNHVYWNLHGMPYDGNKSWLDNLAQTPSILDHTLQLNAVAYIEADSVETLPTGKVLPVQDTALDFVKPTRIGDRIKDELCVPYNGYDHGFFVNGVDESEMTNTHLYFIAQASNETRKFEVWSSCPAVVLYTGNGLQKPHTALCIETQFPPDCPNQAQFPDITIDPNTPWRQTTVWRFA